jgi:broad specificity phosphatase PhoE
MSEQNSANAAPIFSPLSWVPNPWQPPIAYIVRHGETELNAANCYRGWENPVLNEEGERAGEAIANYFSYERLGRVVSSDLDRAQQTAQYVMATGIVACPYLSPDFNLRPWGIAKFAGLEKTSANQKKLDYYIKNPDEQIPDGESLNGFRTRFEDAVQAYLSVPYENLPTVIVTHTSNICALNNLIFGESDDPEVNDLVEPGGILAVYLKEDGTLHMVPRLGQAQAEVEPEAS